MRTARGRGRFRVEIWRAVNRCSIARALGLLGGGASGLPWDTPTVVGSEVARVVAKPNLYACTEQEMHRTRQERCGTQESSTAPNRWPSVGDTPNRICIAQFQGILVFIRIPSATGNFPARVTRTIGRGNGWCLSSHNSSACGWEGGYARVLCLRKVCESPLSLTRWLTTASYRFTHLTAEIQPGTAYT